MMRLLGLLLLLTTSLPAQAQLRAFDDPTLWASASVGFYSWTADASSFNDDNITGNLSVSVASPRWMLQGGFQLVRSFELGGPIDPIPALSSGSGGDDPSYHAIYAIGGPWTASEWFMAGIAVGPALTWGTRVREIPSPSCPPGDEFCIIDLPFLPGEREGYLSPGLAGSVQGFVRLDGRVWLGGETMLVANASSTHLAPRFAVRVDLLRPDR